ncbi:hypothetical protein J4437_07740 [Candidatus Woesearchaeota archaeon]|nr:hypothetical protein [Candidatus Woesearchaeota archaeon]
MSRKSRLGRRICAIFDTRLRGVAPILFVNHSSNSANLALAATYSTEPLIRKH